MQKYTEDKMAAIPNTIRKGSGRGFGKGDMFGPFGIPYGGASPKAVNKLYKFRVSMWCERCGMDVQEVLDAAKGSGRVSDFSIDMKTKRVTVNSSLPVDEVYKILTKAGKEVTQEEPVGVASK